MIAMVRQTPASVPTAYTGKHSRGNSPSRTSSMISRRSSTKPTTRTRPRASGTEGVNSSRSLRGLRCRSLIVHTSRKAGATPRNTCRSLTGQRERSRIRSVTRQSGNVSVKSRRSRVPWRIFSGFFGDASGGGGGDSAHCFSVSQTLPPPALTLDVETVGAKVVRASVAVVGVHATGVLTVGA